jgi:hypothetical protein
MGGACADAGPPIASPLIGAMKRWCAVAQWHAHQQRGTALRRILVPTGFSEPSLTAVGFAIELTQALGCEICGPEFTPNFTTLFCAIQHPGAGGTLESPVSTRPDGTTPPRPSAIAIVQTDGGTIGS